MKEYGVGRVQVSGSRDERTEKVQVCYTVEFESMDFAEKNVDVLGLEET
jgi:hypothetical protein